MSDKLTLTNYLNAFSIIETQHGDQDEKFSNFNGFAPEFVCAIGAHQHRHDAVLFAESGRTGLRFITCAFCRWRSTRRTIFAVVSDK